MAEYRRQLSKYEQKKVLYRYKNHRDADGGIFTESTRRRLLGIKQGSKKGLPLDTPDFWNDVRRYVRNGLKDLELICDVAHPDQLEEMFHKETLTREEQKEMKELTKAWEQTDFLETIPSLKKFIASLFKDYVVMRKRMVLPEGKKYPIPEVIGSDTWKAYLAHDLLVICLKFFNEHNFISTKAHQRLVEEVEDMINVEVSRGIKLKRNERVKGFV